MHLAFEVMPFGLYNAPATFQWMMDHVLRDCRDFARAYIDDIIIFSRSLDQHFRQVFERLQLEGLTVKLKKCQFGWQEVPYLGHIIGGGKLRSDPKKSQAVKKYPRPMTKKDVQAYLGLVGYYQWFVPRFAAVAAPLTDLTCKHHLQQVKWSAETEIAFQKLKSVLIEMPVLGVADPSQPYVLQTDGRGEEHPIAYASQKLLPREIKYSIIKKECLAVVWALKFFHI